MRSATNLARFALIGLATALAACGGGDGPTAPGNTESSAVVELTPQTFETMVLQGAGPVLVEFYGATCSHCRSMVPIVEQLARDYRGRVVVARIELGAAQGILQQQDVTLIPTFVTYRGGRPLERLVGATSYQTLAQLVENALAGR